MTIPDKPLALHYDPSNPTLGEIRLFNLKSGMTPADRVEALTMFLLEHSDWTPAEIHAIKSKELLDVGKQIGERLRADAVPLPNRPRSKVGRGSTKRKTANP